MPRKVIAAATGFTDTQRRVPAPDNLTSQEGLRRPRVWNKRKFRKGKAEISRS